MRVPPSLYWACFFLFFAVSQMVLQSACTQADEHQVKLDWAGLGPLFSLFSRSCVDVSLPRELAVEQLFKEVKHAELDSNRNSRANHRINQTRVKCVGGSHTMRAEMFRLNRATTRRVARNGIRSNRNERERSSWKKRVRETLVGWKSN